MKIFLLALSCIILGVHAMRAASISEDDGTYRNICLKAAEDLSCFQSFRSIDDYTHVVEVGGGGNFADYLNKNASDETVLKYADFEKLDVIGNPRTGYYPGIGNFSGTTLRYIVVADQIKEKFLLPDNALIAEIGAGFGGQCYILSQLQEFQKYYMYDLPEVEALIEKTMDVLQVENTVCLPMECDIPEESIDLVISNYAFSECTRATQLDYFEKVIKKSKRGYVIYNQILTRVFGRDHLSPSEFVRLLEQCGKNPKVCSEPVATDVDNLLIIWDAER